MGTLTNSEDPDEMLQNVAFDQDLHYFEDKIDLQSKKYNIVLEISSDPSVYTMDHPY